MTTARSDLSRLTARMSTANPSYPSIAASDHEDLAQLMIELSIAEDLARSGRVKVHALLVISAAASADAETAGDMASLLNGVATMTVSDDAAAAAIKPTPSSSRTLPLFENLDVFAASLDGQPLIKLPPKMNPVPPKPYVFDVAFNEIEYPTRNIEVRAAGMDRIAVGVDAGSAKSVAAQQKATGSGIVSDFFSLFGMSK
jgi:hypothetical protein